MIGVGCNDLKRKTKTLLTLFLVSRQLYTSPYKGSKLWEALKPTQTTQILKILRNFRYIKYIKALFFSCKSSTATLTPNQTLHCPQCIKKIKARVKDRYDLT